MPPLRPRPAAASFVACLALLLAVAGPAPLPASAAPADAPATPGAPTRTAPARTAPDRTTPDRTQPVDDQRRTRWLVRYENQAAARAGTLRAAGEGVAVGRTLRHVFPGAVVAMTEAQARRMRQRPGVVTVRPDTRVRAAGVDLAPPPGLDRIDQRGRALSGSYTSHFTGRGVRVYVVDSGINLEHVDFSGRIRRGPDFADVDVTQGDDPWSLPPRDCHGHGTHVAGIAAGSTHGVARQATLVPTKVLDCFGEGYASDTIAALEWIIADHAAAQPAVANLSLTGPRDPLVDAAVTALLRDGVTVVSAAGNVPAGTTNHDACALSPSAVSAAITVGNSTSADARSSTSNDGRCVDLFAPGTDVLSAYVGGDHATARMSGTSMAAPAVSGAAALVLQARPAWTPARVAGELLGKATTGVVTGISTATPNRLLYTLGGVTPGTIERAPAPTLVGQPVRGTTLVARAGTWGVGSVSLRYDWYRVSTSGKRFRIPGQHGPRYPVTRGDRGLRLQLAVTGSSPDRLNRTTWSSRTSVVR